MQEWQTIFTESLIRRYEGNFVVRKIKLGVKQTHNSPALLQVKHVISLRVTQKDPIKTHIFLDLIRGQNSRSSVVRL